MFTLELCVTPVSPLKPPKFNAISPDISNMQCTLCNGFEGSEKSVAAHICGSHDEDHEAFVGLNDDGKPLLRADHETNEPDEPEPTTKQVESTGSSGDTAAVAGGLVGLGLLRYLNDDSNDRDTM